MTTVVHRVNIGFLLIAQLALGAGGLHQHEFVAKSGAGNTPPCVTTHTCGTREIHIPVEDLARCPICMTGTSRSATVTAADHPPSPSAVSWIAFDHPSAVPAPVDIHSSGKRGPPLY
jgi:hypothetical protein